ncbi:MAG: hypothetical protein PWP49_1204 [Thermococcaceae archaeon]|jgi:hypothetical protein|nr:hypothetical protein [Thermococcus litoralis]MDK2983598.1 hypothetical protein [Thermococcaceae archaeon]MDN5320784.1 hypothetical protein [Thermococcaceae archaeon]HIH71800.1 hypothetical protein [Thermococcaceae archaeon]
MCLEGVLREFFEKDGVLLFANNTNALKKAVNYAQLFEREALNLRNLLGLAFKQELQKLAEKPIKLLLKQGAEVRQIYVLELGEKHLVEVLEDVSEVKIVIGLKRDAELVEVIKSFPIKILKELGYDIERVEKKDTEIEIVCRKGRIVLSGGISVEGLVEEFEGFVFWAGEL